MCAPSLVETLRPPAAVKRAREPHRLRGRIHLSKQINVYIYIYIERERVREREREI